MRKRPSLEEVLRHRQQLIECAEAQRERIGEALAALRAEASWIDRGLEAGTYLRSHPLVLVGGAIAVLLVLRRPLLRGGLLGIARRGFLAWRIVHSVRSLALKFAR